jgi:CDP-glucose 4,6-dehydratase
LAEIRNPDTLIRAIKTARPSVVFHLAAQALVNQSYRDPAETYAVNVMGTVNLLRAIGQADDVRAVVNVTSDKCYDNREWLWPYRENEPLGGHDPYSSSKACAELVTAAWRDSFFRARGIHLASARAGNVIGGGDWAPDRLIPDFFRARATARPLRLRWPGAVRPWQHVLEPLAGYLMLAERLCMQGGDYAQAWNFGPRQDDARPVRWIADYLSRRVDGAAWEEDSIGHPHEALTLRLDSSQAMHRLGWQPRWSLETALDKTLGWYEAWHGGAAMADYSLAQIAEYEGIEGA